MYILATISNMAATAVLLEAKTGVTQLIPSRPSFFDNSLAGRAPFRPFGITWTKDELFIANNKQLLVFDQRLNYLRTETVTLYTNTHQLAYNGSCIWAASPWTNSLLGVYPNSRGRAIELDLTDHRLRISRSRDVSDEDDSHHFNSLLWTFGKLFVAAHNFQRPSFITCYHGATCSFESVFENVGSKIHGLACDRNELFWISTGTNEILSSRGFRLRLTRPGFGRGFALTKEFIVVGISEFRNRASRIDGGAWIQIIDRQTSQTVQEFHFSDSGGINDLRILDAHDLAHHIAAFW